MREKDIGPNACEIVAEDFNGELVGSAIVFMERDQSAQLGYISVRGQFRGNGWGSKLFDEASRWARDHGATKMRGALIPVPGYEQALLALLSKHGAEVKKGKFTKKL